MKKMCMLVIFALLTFNTSAYYGPKQIDIACVTLRIGMSLSDVQAAFTNSPFQISTHNSKDYLIKSFSDYPSAFTIKNGKVVKIQKFWTSEKGELQYSVGKALYNSLEKYQGKVTLDTIQRYEPDFTAVNHIRIRTESGVEVVLIIEDHKTLGRSISVHEIIQ